MSFEALSHAGAEKSNILVILNDNDMSISENVGGLNNYFARIWKFKTIHRYKEKWEKSLEEPPYCSSSCKNCGNKYENHGCTRGIFEELGWNYIGPIDGHNIQQLIEVIDNLKI